MRINPHVYSRVPVRPMAYGQEPTPPMLGITKLHVGRAMVFAGSGFLIKTMFFTKHDEGFWPSMGLGAFLIALGFWTGPSHQ